MRRVFFFNDTATTEIYTLSLHDALPISRRPVEPDVGQVPQQGVGCRARGASRPTDGVADPDHLAVVGEDRKSTRLNSSHANISYAVFCLKKKKTQTHLWSPLSTPPSNQR